MWHYINRNESLVAPGPSGLPSDHLKYQDQSTHMAALTSTANLIWSLGLSGTTTPSAEISVKFPRRNTKCRATLSGFSPIRAVSQPRIRGRTPAREARCASSSRSEVLPTPVPRRRYGESVSRGCPPVQPHAVRRALSARWICHAGSNQRGPRS